MWSRALLATRPRGRLLKQLPTSGPRVLQGPGENAGVGRHRRRLAVAFKIESHNHPSFIEPYQGAATGVGGILRDVFTMGARPIANLNSLRFGEHRPSAHAHLVNGRGGRHRRLRQLHRRAHASAARSYFDAGYNGNILVNAFTLGVVRGRPDLPRASRRASATR